MESMGPVRPNLITRWTKFQAQENPQQYDLDDGIVIAQEKAQPNKAKKNLRSRNKDILYQDSIIVQMGPGTQKPQPVATQPPQKEFFPHVKVEIFMESLCPDTHRFVKGALSKVAHDPGMMCIVDLHIYVFGKGSQISTDPQKFSCQHGPAECYGNLVENCIVKYASPGDAIDMMVCLHDRRSFDEMSLAACSKELEDSSVNTPITNCINGEGKFLLQKAFDKTPRNLNYVPSMRINKGAVVPASSNLKDVICKEWKGEKPQSCT